MRSALIIVILLGTLVVSGSAAVNAQQISDPVAAVSGGALIGHLQPRAQQFSPRSPAEQVEQQQCRFSMPSNRSWTKSSTRS